MTKKEAEEKLAASSWSSVMIFLTFGVLLGNYVVSSVQPNWHPPLQSELSKVGGTFQNPTIPGVGYRPYIFVDDSGIQHTLGCDPEIRVVHCLEKDGTSRQSLTGQHVVISYFKVNTPWWEGRRVAYPEILMTVDAPDRSILNFASSDARIRQTQTMQNHTHNVFFVLESTIPILFLFLAARISILKLKANRRRS